MDAEKKTVKFEIVSSCSERGMVLGPTPIYKNGDVQLICGEGCGG